MRGLPPVMMSAAVGLAWVATIIPGVTYVLAAGVTMSAAWFLVKLVKK